MVGRHFSGSWLTLPGNENKRGGEKPWSGPPLPRRCQSRRNSSGFLKLGIYEGSDPGGAGDCAGDPRCRGGRS